MTVKFLLIEIKRLFRRSDCDCDFLSTNELHRIQYKCLHGVTLNPIQPLSCYKPIAVAILPREQPLNELIFVFSSKFCNISGRQPISKLYSVPHRVVFAYFFFPWRQQVVTFYFPRICVIFTFKELCFVYSSNK